MENVLNVVHSFPRVPSAGFESGLFISSLFSALCFHLSGEYFENLALRGSVAIFAFFLMPPFFFLSPFTPLSALKVYSSPPLV